MRHPLILFRDLLLASLPTTGKYENLINRVYFQDSLPDTFYDKYMQDLFYIILRLDNVEKASSLGL